MPDQGIVGKRGIDWSMCTHDPKEIQAILEAAAQVYVRAYHAGTFDLESFYRRREEKEKNKKIAG